MSSLSETIRQKVSESGYPGLKDEQDENKAFITNYLLLALTCQYEWDNHG